VRYIYFPCHLLHITVDQSMISKADVKVFILDNNPKIACKTARM